MEYHWIPIALIFPCSEICPTDTMKGIGGTNTEGDNDGFYSAIGWKDRSKPLSYLSRGLRGSGSCKGRQGHTD